MLKCLMCAKTFAFQSNLSLHLSVHTKEKPYKCLACPAVFSSKGHLDRHKRTLHALVKIVAKKNLQCPKCSYRCSGRTNLKQHLLKHSEERPFSCNVPGCNFRTKYERHLPDHTRAAHSEERPYECTVEGCTVSSAYKSNIYGHLKTHSNEKPFACKFLECKFACKTNVGLKRHTFRMHTDEKPLTCSVCDFRTKYRSTLRKHEDEHENIKRFRCQAPKCSFVTHSNCQLQDHWDRKHRQKDFFCTAPGCNYRCATIAILKQHNYTHVLPLLKCPVESCVFGTRFITKLRSHVSRKHKDTATVPVLIDLKCTCQTSTVEKFICPFSTCDYQTEFQHRYASHVKMHDEDKQRHVCQFCSVIFGVRGHLERHIQGHLGERRYKCSHCDYSTIDSGRLREHAGRIHHIYVISPRQRYQLELNCRTCGRMSASYNQCVLHSMTHLKPVVVLKRLILHVM